MTITPETGSGDPNADAYIDVTYLTAFATARGLDIGSLAENEQAIVGATEYIDARYSFRGAKTSKDNALSWPRTGAGDVNEGIVYDSNEVPAVVKRACAMLACKIIGGTVLLEDLSRGGQVLSEKVGDIAVTYADREGVDVGTTFGITGLFKGLLKDAGWNPMPSSGSSVDGGYFTTGQFQNEGTG